jgi:hypothetical protein
MDSGEVLKNNQTEDLAFPKKAGLCAEPRLEPAPLRSFQAPDGKMVSDPNGTTLRVQHVVFPVA